MVIQRWQSLLLLIASALMFCFSFASLGQLQAEAYSLNITALGLFYEGEATGTGLSGCYLPTAYLFILTLISAIIPLINIFLFKNLRLQRKVCLVEVLFIVASMATAAAVVFTAVPGVTPGWSTVVLCPFLALILDIMAWRFIRRDHNLLISADRLR